MKKESLLWKQGTIFVVLLFCGLAFAPSIHANVSKDSELVEITTEVCGLPGQKPQTIHLTKDDAEAVDRLFEKIKFKLDYVKSREEAVEMFNEAIVELDKYGLLGNIDVKKAQRIVLGPYQYPRFMQFLERIYDRRLTTLNENENVCCLVVGKTSHTIFARFLNEMYMGLLYLFRNLFPFPIGCIIYLGELEFFGHDRPASGWLYTRGSNGIKKWDGKMWGDLPLLSYYIGGVQLIYLSGILGFTGIQFFLDYSSDQHFYLGFALWVRVVYD